MAKLNALGAQVKRPATRGKSAKSAPAAKPISLAPLKFEEAVGDLLKVKLQKPIRHQKAS